MSKRSTASGNPFAALYRSAPPPQAPIALSPLISGPVVSGPFVLVVGFWTNLEYFREIVFLHDSMEKFGLSYCTRYIPGKESWAEAVTAKPRFILQSLQDTEAEAVLYTDADSSFKRKPDWSLFDGADVAWHRFTRVEGSKAELLTGTMFFRRSPEVLAFLGEWVEEVEKAAYRDRFTPEQDALRVVWEEHGWSDRLRFADPGPSWCFIFDDMREIYPGLEPVIEHRQASRKYRHAKKEGAETTAQEATQAAHQAAGSAPGFAPPAAWDGRRLGGSE